MYIQDIIERLQDYWRGYGCSIISSLDLPKGAATFHTQAVFLLLEKKEVSLAFFDRVLRPNDGIGTKNSTRSFTHHQFEVLVKKENGVLIVEDFINSLKSIGITKEKFCIEFLEDNWSHETLDAKGFGWEVRCNSLEVTQITYFQLLCGIKFNSYPAELAYGIERLAMILQNKNSIFDLMWSKDLKYSELFIKEEEESAFYMPKYETKEDFNNVMNKYESALNECMFRKSFSYLLQASHIFNMLCAGGKLNIDAQKSMRNDIKKNVSKMFQRYMNNK